MKLIKSIDVWVQFFLYATCIVLCFVLQVGGIVYSYFIIGGWQLLSMIVHEAKGWFIPKGSQRRRYQHAVYLIVLLMLGSIVVPKLLYILGFLFFAAPLMAIYYTSICYRETYYSLRRPLSLLK